MFRMSRLTSLRLSWGRLLPGAPYQLDLLVSTKALVSTPPAAPVTSERVLGVISGPLPDACNRL
jgi:hypothetical protein